MEGRERGRQGSLEAWTAAPPWPEGPGPEPRRAVLHSGPLCTLLPHLRWTGRHGDTAGLGLRSRDQLAVLGHVDGIQDRPAGRGGPSDKRHLGLDTAVSCHYLTPGTSVSRCWASRPGCQRVLTPPREWGPPGACVRLAPRTRCPAPDLWGSLWPRLPDLVLLPGTRSRLVQEGAHWRVPHVQVSPQHHLWAVWGRTRAVRPTAPVPPPAACTCALSPESLQRAMGGAGPGDESRAVPHV